MRENFNWTKRLSPRPELGINKLLINISER